MKKILIGFFVSLFLFSPNLLAQNLADHEYVWKAHNGETYTTSDFSKMSYKIATMVFTSCPSACPLMVKHLKQLDKKLDSDVKKDVVYLLFSIDPLDTREQLKKFHASMGLDERFILLKNEGEGVIQELAMLLGFKYKKVSESMYSHSTNVYLFDQDDDLKSSVSQSYKSSSLSESINN